MLSNCLNVWQCLRHLCIIPYGILKAFSLSFCPITALDVGFVSRLISRAVVDLLYLYEMKLITGHSPLIYFLLFSLISPSLRTAESTTATGTSSTGTGGPQWTSEARPSYFLLSDIGKIDISKLLCNINQTRQWTLLYIFTNKNQTKNSLSFD